MSEQFAETNLPNTADARTVSAECAGISYDARAVSASETWTSTQARAQRDSRCRFVLYLVDGRVHRLGTASRSSSRAIPGLEISRSIFSILASKPSGNFGSASACDYLYWSWTHGQSVRRGIIGIRLRKSCAFINGRDHRERNDFALHSTCTWLPQCTYSA